MQKAISQNFFVLYNNGVMPQTFIIPPIIFHNNFVVSCNLLPTQFSAAERHENRQFSDQPIGQWRSQTVPGHEDDHPQGLQRIRSADQRHRSNKGAPNSTSCCRLLASAMHLYCAVRAAHHYLIQWWMRRSGFYCHGQIAFTIYTPVYVIFCRSLLPLNSLMVNRWPICQRSTTWCPLGPLPGLLDGEKQK